jgi:hypothetical protein
MRFFVNGARYRRDPMLRHVAGKFLNYAEWVRASILVTVSALIVIGVGLGILSVTGRASTSVPTTSTTRPRLSPLAVEIDQLAVDWAAGAGNPDPESVTWAVCPLGGDTAFCPPGQPQYQLEISAGGGPDFSIYAAGSGGRLPQAPFVTVSVDPSNWSFLGFALSPTFQPFPPFLRSETDSLAGIPPISRSAVKRRFHVKCQIGDASGIC